MSVGFEIIVKMLVVYFVELENGLGLVVFVLCGDKEFNEIKVEKYLLVVLLLIFVIEEEVEKIIGCKFGLIGFIGLSILVIVDLSVVNLVDFVCGVNCDGFYLKSVNWECDV